MPGPSELARIEDGQPEAGMTLPLEGPRVFGSINIRVTLIPPADAPDQKLLALEQSIDTLTLSALATKMHRGTVELDITDAFGKQRSLRVSTAELIVMLQMAEKFVQELPA